ncbi:MAG: sigma-70 family RNA polymerase sigma factor [Clostridia bacterium]
MSVNGVEKQFDTYIKKTIKNAILDFKKYESRKEHREVSFETLTSEKDISVPFLFHINSNAIEDYIENEKLYQIISNLKPMQKKVLKLKIIYQYTSEQIAKILNRSNSRIKHIYSDTIREIVKKMEE